MGRKFMATRSFRKQLEDAVLERHCANHPMTEKWARGEVGNRCMMGWAAEQWHWVSKMTPPTFFICKDAPDDAIHAGLPPFALANFSMISRCEWLGSISSLKLSISA